MTPTISYILHLFVHIHTCVLKKEISKLALKKYMTKQKLFSNYILLFSPLLARESWRQNTSWGDIVEEEPARLPGHGIHMHEKLSSPSRKRSGV